MIVISRKVDYGILALHHLMQTTDGASARELADQFALSRAFLANILKQLCQEGIVASQRGVNGGYRLAVPAEQISLERVITALDGPFRLMTCAGDGEGAACDLEQTCPVKSPLRLVHDRLRQVLAEVSLADLKTPADCKLIALETETATNGCAADLPG